MKKSNKENSKLLIAFPDPSQSFTYGVEYGRMLQKMQDGKDIIENSGFPVRVENKQVLEKTCEVYNYIPIFGKEHYGEWIEFLGIKKTSSDN